MARVKVLNKTPEQKRKDAVVTQRIMMRFTLPIKKFRPHRPSRLYDAAVWPCRLGIHYIPEGYIVLDEKALEKVLKEACACASCERGETSPIVLD